MIRRLTSMGGAAGACVTVTYQSDDEAAAAAKSELATVADTKSVLLLKGDGSDPEIVANQHGNIVKEFGDRTSSLSEYKEYVYICCYEISL